MKRIVKRLMALIVVVNIASFLVSCGGGGSQSPIVNTLPPCLDVKITSKPRELVLQWVPREGRLYSVNIIGGSTPMEINPAVPPISIPDLSRGLYKVSVREYQPLSTYNWLETCNVENFVYVP